MCCTFFEAPHTCIHHPLSLTPLPSCRLSSAACGVLTKGIGSRFASAFSGNLCPNRAWTVYFGLWLTLWLLCMLKHRESCSGRYRAHAVASGLSSLGQATAVKRMTSRASEKQFACGVSSTDKACRKVTYERRKKNRGPNKCRANAAIPSHALNPFGALLPRLGILRAFRNGLRQLQTCDLTNTEGLDLVLLRCYGFSYSKFEKAVASRPFCGVAAQPSPANAHTVHFIALNNTGA